MGALTEAVRKAQSDWDPDLHPRGPDGRFVRVLSGLVGRLAEVSDVGRLFRDLDDALQRRVRAEEFYLALPNPPKPKIDKDVRDRVKTGRSASDYLSSELGIGGDLSDLDHARHMPQDPGLRAEFFQQIVQAVKDMVAKHPALRDPESGLKEVNGYTPGQPNWSTVPHDVKKELRKGMTWGITASSDGDGTWTAADLARNPGTAVNLNGANVDIADQTLMTAAGGALARAGMIPYGRMVHELGHAFDHATGLENETLGPVLDDTRIRELLEEVDLTPGDAALLSYYASQVIPEFFAETFATFNTPGIWDEQVYPDIVPKLQAFRYAVNRWLEEHGKEPSL